MLVEPPSWVKHNQASKHGRYKEHLSAANVETTAKDQELIDSAAFSVAKFDFGEFKVRPPRWWTLNRIDLFGKRAGGGNLFAAAQNIRQM